jgi:hypothetical protein
MRCVSVWVSLARLSGGVKKEPEQMEKGRDEEKGARKRQSDEKVMHPTF